MAKINLRLIVVIMFLISCSVLGNHEFRTYFVADFFEVTSSDDTCCGTLSMYKDWIFGGLLIINADDTVFNTTCEQLELTIVADYPSKLESLKILAHVTVNGRERNQTSNPKEAAMLTIYDDIHLNESIDTWENSSSQSTHSFVTSNDVLRLKFSSRIERNWSLIFTAFHTGFCHSYEYMCANKRCIFHSLSCNKYDPCGDQSDCLISPVAYASLAFGGLCTLGVIFVIIYIFVKSRKASDWSSKDRQPRKFSPAKALQSVQAFTPATLDIMPKRRWSYKY